MPCSNVGCGISSQSFPIHSTLSQFLTLSYTLSSAFLQNEAPYLFLKEGTEVALEKSFYGQAGDQHKASTVGQLNTNFI